MEDYRIAVFRGDGIGPEVMEATLRLLEAVRAVGESVGVGLEFIELPAGLEASRALGDALPAASVDRARSCDGIMLGPVMSHLYDATSSTMRNPSRVLRRDLDLYANVRPVRSLPGVRCLSERVDLVVVRENTEGFYADRNLVEGNGELRVSHDLVMSVRVVTRRASERVARAAFELARARGQLGKVTFGHKANVLQKGCGLFLEACRSVAAEFPDVSTDDAHVDALSMHVVMRPETFDVIVTTNLFGDVLSDTAAGLVGGLGLAPGLNAGDDLAMAQAVHGAAPDIAGKGIANPVAEILSASLLLTWLAARRHDQSLRHMAGEIDAAVEDVLRQRIVRTPDLGGKHGTFELAEAVTARFMARMG